MQRFTFVSFFALRIILLAKAHGSKSQCTKAKQGSCEATAKQNAVNLVQTNAAKVVSLRSGAMSVALSGSFSQNQIANGRLSQDESTQGVHRLNMQYDKKIQNQASLGNVIHRFHGSKVSPSFAKPNPKISNRTHDKSNVPSTAALSEDDNDYIAALKDDKASLGFTSAVLLLSGVSILLTWILNKLDPKASVVYNGFRRTKYTASLAWQLIVLPVCIGFMFNWSAPSSLPQFLEWAQRGRLQFKAAPCYFFAALTATQLKDFITEIDELWRSQKMFWHHVVVVVTCVYAEWLPEGYGNFALVCFALELGSACFNLCSIFPWSRLAWCLFHCSFATSHMIALCGLWLMFSYDQLHMLVRLIFAMSGIGVILGRQVVSIIKVRKGFDDHLHHIHDTHDEDVKHNLPEDKTI